MPNIKTFEFNKCKFEEIKKFSFGFNWPVVYLIEDGKEVYIGESVNVYMRSNQHYEKPERRRLNNIHIINDEEYNKSTTLDIESSLIQYISADGKFILQNGNNGLKNHNYFDRQKYQAKFEIIWQKLKKMKLVQNDLDQIRNSDLFKYSPYKALTIDQKMVANELINEIKSGKAKRVKYSDLANKIKYPSKDKLTKIFNNKIKELYESKTKIGKRSLTREEFLKYIE